MQVKAAIAVARDHARTRNSERATMGMGMITDSDGCAADAAGGDADEGRWAERLAEASSDYEAIDAETLAGLGCDRW